MTRVLRAHLETFLARFTDEHGGRTLPAYVERESRYAPGAQKPAMRSIIQ